MLHLNSQLFLNFFNYCKNLLGINLTKRYLSKIINILKIHTVDMVLYVELV